MHNDNQYFAICPECMERKSILASRCPHCTVEIGYLRQMVAMLVYWGSIILTFGFIILLFKACSG